MTTATVLRLFFQDNLVKMVPVTIKHLNPHPIITVLPNTPT